jgi:hypothetical protein
MMRGDGVDGDAPGDAPTVATSPVSAPVESRFTRFTMEDSIPLGRTRGSAWSSPSVSDGISTAGPPQCMHFMALVRPGAAAVAQYEQRLRSQRVQTHTA